MAAGAAGVPAAPRVTELDLAISFDVTGSMGPCIFQVRRELARLSKELFEDLAGMGVSVRVAVITQADYDASPYVTRHMDFPGDGAAVGAFITGVQASSGHWTERGRGVRAGAAARKRPGVAGERDQGVRPGRRRPPAPAHVACE